MTADITTQHIIKTKELIDDLKAVCVSFGLGNDGDEFKIITQIFLYKYLNDKFTYELKKIHPDWFTDDQWIENLKALPDDDYKKLEFEIDSDIAFLKPHHFLPYLFNRQDEPDFAKQLDETLLDIAAENNELFALTTADGVKVRLFTAITEYVKSKRDAFAKALINKLVIFNFEDVMGEGFDFFSTIFEYLIKGYNNDAGGTYAEYYTPHAVAKVMAAIMIPSPVSNVTIFDPSAGSGTLLMNLAHAIGPKKCTVYSQDISQKSSNLLRLNLTLNNLVHSIQNVIEGNTLTEPYHRDQKFDYIVSNPPFKLDFSDDLDALSRKENKQRFFAGLPNVPKKAKDKMAIYPLFIQHIMHVLADHGKAAVVVPTGFITAQSGIEKRIRTKLVEEKMLAGVVSMPSNIFATTGTNVSILFLDKTNSADDAKVVLIDASGLGKTIKEGKNQKTVLQPDEEQQIINTFIKQEVIDDFSVAVSYDEIKEKNYSLSAGQYFEIKIEYDEISENQFNSIINKKQEYVDALFSKSKLLEKKISETLKSISYE
ncbi:class I SAM-dependent DNA methyltransferase [uncultured Dokdonia sp.]|uniref:HsdM family class I SAM-dependent methyltransferase n=1 Tax=uncultured Dokdonia sp. TaxID=575653 RepID=UPI002606AD0D|nr:class I SAM-dependent DNA methyltransferase [uncultured Dokdonia sp.]